MTPEPVKKFVEFFSRLPSIGPRQATRLAFYLVEQGKATIADLADALRNLGELTQCARCFHITKAAGAICEICMSRERRQNVIAIVEKETDLLSFEKTKKFSGRYLVVGEIAKDGMLSSMQKLRLNHLKEIVRKELAGKAEEIIVALNPTTYGDMDAALIVQELKPFAKRITRLGRGLPTGGEIEFADEETLGGALEHRG